MKETAFIEQKREKWAEYEALLREKNPDPAKLNELFIQITDDLSYARTFYPARSVRKYLNGLAQQVFHNIYRGKRLKLEELKLFWTDELPALLWQHRMALLLSFLLFVLSFAIGVVSSQINPDFASVVLGEDYVRMTMNNIENGDPMGVYKDSKPLGMTVGIAANNLFVALRTALFGVLASIGTVFILLYNGIMAGAFQYFFIEQGLFWPSFLTIWIHGTLEISAIIIAGAAGLVAGSGLLFPGTYTRTQAFQVTMRNGMKIFLGVAPIIVLAAIFEGFLTRYTETPAFIRGAIIGLSLFFVLWYFVWYPRHKALSGAFKKENYDYEIPPVSSMLITWSRIKHGGELLSDAFTLMRKYAKPAFLAAMLTALLFTLFAFWQSPEDILNTFEFLGGNSWSILTHSGAFFNNSRVDTLFLGQCFFMSALAYGCFVFIETKEMKQKWGSWTAHMLGFLWTGIAIIPAVYLLGLFNANILTRLLQAPLLLFYLIAAVSFFEKTHSIGGLARSFKLVQWRELLVVSLLCGLLHYLMILFLGSPLWNMTLDLMIWLVPNEGNNLANFKMLSTVLAVATITYLFLIFVAVNVALLYYSGREISDARALLERIAEVGKTPRIRGLAKE